MSRRGGVTVDTGFLIALERSKPRALKLLNRCRVDALRITVPVAVVAEWWRGGGHASVLRAFEVEPMTERLAKRAGEAIAAVSGATVVDAIVMASAAQRDDVVYTSDFDDLSQLRDRCFRSVRVLGV
jgi:predicted nucleic acid-binding protein